MHNVVKLNRPFDVILTFAFAFVVLLCNIVVSTTALILYSTIVPIVMCATASTTDRNTMYKYSTHIAGYGGNKLAGTRIPCHRLSRHDVTTCIVVKIFVKI